MAKRTGDVVQLSDAEMAEVARLRIEIPLALAKAGDLFREATMDQFRSADAESGKLLKRWRELMGD